MARAIIGGLVRHGVPGSDILVVNPRNPKSTGEVKAMYGAIPSAPEDIRGADTVVVAVKPQSFPDAAPAYRDFIAPGALKAYEEKLANRPFARCNSGYLVNLAQVRGVQQSEVQVGPHTLQISRPRRKAFLAALADYIGGEGV